MAAKAAQTGGVISVRGKQLFLTPPGILGFNDMAAPQDPFGDGLKFTADLHYNEPQVERLGDLTQRDCIDAMWSEFLKALEKANKDPKKYVKPDTGREWVEEHLKTPGEKSRMTEPYIKWSNEADYKDHKTGEIKRKRMNAYDAKGALLDSSIFAKLGRGSICQAVLAPGIFISGLIKTPTPTFKLQGLKIIKLEEFGAGGRSLAPSDDDDLVGIGDVEADDLSQFVGSMTAKKEEPKSPKPYYGSGDDLDDDIPF